MKDVRSGGQEQGVLIPPTPLQSPVEERFTPRITLNSGIRVGSTPCACELIAETVRARAVETRVDVNFIVFGLDKSYNVKGGKSSTGRQESSPLYL